MSVAADTAHLKTPEDLRTALRLDYQGTPFPKKDASVFVMRFRSPGIDDVKPSYNSAMGGQNPRLDSYSDPFTGNGFLKASDDLIPECMPDKSVSIDDGAEIWEITDTGTRRLAAVFSEAAGSWIPVKG